MDERAVDAAAAANDDVAQQEEVIGVRELLAKEVAAEIDAAVRASRPCTYTQTLPALDDIRAGLSARGFMHPIYACTTCADISGVPVGVCEPCMLRCHADHEVHEVGLRRTFRCDCPTERSTQRCVAQPKESDPCSGLPMNGGNSYGHNFAERWCSCDGPFDGARDTMLQCISCDEWYHDRHMPGYTSTLDSEAAVCASCVRSRPFLRAFTRYDTRSCSRALAHSSGHALMSTPAKEKPTGNALTAVTPASAGQDTAAATPADSAVPDAPPAVLQPWVVCLTCTKGADDGRGVCMACAARCHAGHVLGTPRITMFYCDCDELKRGDGAAGTGCECAANDAAAPADASSQSISIEPQPWCAARTPFPMSPPAPIVDTATRPPAPDAVLPLPAGFAEVPSACIFVANEDDLIQSLCKCAACMSVYADFGVATWWVRPPDDDDTVATAADQFQDSPGQAFAPASQATSASQPAPPTGMAGKRAAFAAAMAGGLSGDNLRALFPALPPGFRTSYEAGLDALQTLPVMEQLSAAHAYNELSSEMMPFLRQFADSGKVITEEDIRTFFARLSEARRVRPRMADLGE